MLARSTVVRQAANAVRGNKFSVLTLAEEFPTKGIVHATPTAPVVQNQKLDNGIKFISRSRDGGLVNVRFAVLGGTSTESSAQKGAAHFLATAAYTGNNNSSGLQLVHHLDSLGAKYTATADREKIVYDLSVLSNRADDAISTVLASIASGPASNHVYEEHRETAQLYYDDFHGDASKQLRELVHEAAFGESSGFGGSLFASSLDHLNVADINQYRAKHFVRENLVVAADGISSDNLKKILDSNSRQFASGSAVNVPKASFVGGEVKVRNNEAGSSYVAVAFGAPAGQAGKAYDVLYQTLTNRLQKKKICASTFQSKYHNGGVFGIQTNGGAADIDRILRAAIDELKAIAVDATGTEGARTAFGVSTFSAVDGRTAASVLLDAYLSGSDVNNYADTRAVTNQQVRDAAQAVLKSTPAYAVYGVTNGVPSFTAVSKLLA